MSILISCSKECPIQSRLNIVWSDLSMTDRLTQDFLLLLYLLLLFNPLSNCLQVLIGTGELLLGPMMLVFKPYQLLRRRSMLTGFLWFPNPYLMCWLNRFPSRWDVRLIMIEWILDIFHLFLWFLSWIVHWFRENTFWWVEIMFLGFRCVWVVIKHRFPWSNLHHWLVTILPLSTSLAC